MYATSISLLPLLAVALVAAGCASGAGRAAAEVAGAVIRAASSDRAAPPSNSERRSSEAAAQQVRGGDPAGAAHAPAARPPVDASARGAVSKPTAGPVRPGRG